MNSPGGQALEELHLRQEQQPAANQRIKELERLKTPSPVFVKPREGQKKQRKKRDTKHNRARRREEPTRIVKHRIESCPVYASRLGGVSVARRRQVIECRHRSPKSLSYPLLYISTGDDLGYRVTSVTGARQVYSVPLLEE